MTSLHMVGFPEFVLLKTIVSLGTWEDSSAVSEAILRERLLNEYKLTGMLTEVI